MPIITKSGNDRAFFAVFTDLTLLQLITTFHADTFLPFILQKRQFWLNYHFKRLQENYPGKFDEDAKYLRKNESIPYYNFIFNKANNLYQEYLKSVYNPKIIEEIYDITLPERRIHCVAVHLEHIEIFGRIMKDNKEHIFVDILSQICAKKNWSGWLFSVVEYYCSPESADPRNGPILWPKPQK